MQEHLTPIAQKINFFIIQNFYKTHMSTQNYPQKTK